MEQLLAMGATALRKAALNEEAKTYILQNEPLFNLLKKAAERYIGGETLKETVSKVIRENAAGFKCSIEFMGESTRTVQEAEDATQEFIRICEAIHQQKLRSTVSLDLSHIGLAISADLCFENLSAICTAAFPGNTEVIISAEGTERTDAVIQMYQRASKQFANLSITLQAYLHRTKEDFAELI